jgi:hypothetical protein
LEPLRTLTPKVAYHGATQHKLPVLLLLESLIPVFLIHQWHFCIPQVLSLSLSINLLLVLLDPIGMGLESYRGKARAALASFLSHVINQEGCLYGALLPEQHPFSFCQLLGLTFQELKCLLFLVASLPLRKTCLRNFFLPQAFHEFLSAIPSLNRIHGSKTAVKNYKKQRHYIYSIGNFSLSKAVSRIFGKQETALENGSLQPVHFHPWHCVHIKALVEHLLPCLMKKRIVKVGT